MPHSLPAGSTVQLTGELDPNLSRWLWLVKMFLAIPHYIVLAFLWTAFLVTTMIAGAHVLVTGRYRGPCSTSTSACSAGTGESGSTSTRPSAPTATHRSRWPAPTTPPGSTCPTPSTPARPAAAHIQARRTPAPDHARTEVPHFPGTTSSCAGASHALVAMYRLGVLVRTRLHGL